MLCSCGSGLGIEQEKGKCMKLFGGIQNQDF